MDTQNERVEQVSATKTDQEMKWKELEDRISQIETRLSGMQKGIIALTFLCFVILIINIDWKVMIKGSNYDSQEYWNYSPIKIVVAVVIFVCIIACAYKMCSRESASAEDAFFKKQSGMMAKSI